MNDKSEVLIGDHIMRQEEAAIVLSLQLDSSLEQIKGAYRNLASQLHSNTVSVLPYVLSIIYVYICKYSS
jgi:hypothetical protein